VNVIGMDYDDLDGDGDVDFVGATNSGLTIFTNQGDTDNDGNDNFITSPIDILNSSGVRDVTIADFNGDGKLDIAAVGSQYNEVLFGNGGNGDNVLNNSDYTSSNIGAASSLGQAYGVDSGDINGDGFVDFARTNYYNSPLQILYSDGAAGTFSTQVIQDEYNQNSLDLDIGDIDGDGDLDFLVTRWGNSSAAIYYNDGDTNNDGQLEFTTQETNSNDYNMEGELFDIDGDGDLDILLADYLNGEIDIFFNDGGRSFSKLTLKGTSRSPNGLAVGDIDEDGDFDIVMTGSGNATVFVNNGDTNNDEVIDFTSEALAGTSNSWEVAFINAATTAAETEDGTDITVDLAALSGDVDSDEDGTTLTYTVSSAPTEGAASINGTTLTFAPGTAFQDLALNETRDVSVEVTATDKYNATAVNSVTLTVTGTNDAPVITPDAVAASGSVTEAGHGQVGVAYATGMLKSSDVDNASSATWSSENTTGIYGSFAIDPTTGEWSYTLDNNNTATEALTEDQVGTEVFTVTVTDDFGAIDLQDVTVNVVGTNDSPPSQLIWGSHAGGVRDDPASAVGGDDHDTISFGGYAGYDKGSASADGGAGNDTITFAGQAGYRGSVTADGGDGNDIIDMGSQAGMGARIPFENPDPLSYSMGSAIAKGGAGDDTIKFAHSGSRGYLSADGGAGNDTIEFIGSTAAYGIAMVTGGEGDDDISMGGSSAVWGGVASIKGGAGNDKISIGDYVGHSSQGASITNPLATEFEGVGVIVDGGAGNDEITFGIKAGYSNGSVIADGGDGNDMIRFGIEAGFKGGSVRADGGAGDDEIIFGENAASGFIHTNWDPESLYYGGSVTADGGDGDDTISFGNFAGNLNGSVIANGGAGADTFIFGHGAENLTIDLGAGDGDKDSVTFKGSVKNATIDNWVSGVDANIDVVDPGVWGAEVVGGDTVLTTGDGQSLTFIGIADANPNVSDFLI
jgi:VCBS repeat-containing protein